MYIKVPESIELLMDRAGALSGRTLQELAEQLDIDVPHDLRRAKGWVGHLLERSLGVRPSGRPGPDFPALGIELKTIPVTPAGHPRESTWVCRAPLDGRFASTWEQSDVWAKIARVLFVPIVGNSTIAIGDRVVARPFLWTPTKAQVDVLRDDWEGLRELLALGEIGHVNAHFGEALQLRPKAASASELTWVVDADGEWVRANPRGFYLRTRFTRKILKRHFALR